VAENIIIDEMDVVNDGYTRVGRKGDETESIPGLLGTGKWRRLKGGVTMDSGCSIDTQCPQSMPPTSLWAQFPRAEPTDALMQPMAHAYGSTESNS
jgi:hypothetical protein